jgi:hypothetical protein
MQEFLDSPAFNQIMKLKGHARSEAIESFVNNSNKNNEKISILIFALSDGDYGFCTYETCVKSAAAYLYDLREFLKDHVQREELLKILLNDLDVSFSDTDDNIDRVKLLGTFKGEAKSALRDLKNALDEFESDSEYLSEEWYKDSFEYKCRLTLMDTIHLIESE